MRLLCLMAALCAACTQTKIIGETQFQGLADSFLIPEPPGRVKVKVDQLCDPGCAMSGSRFETIHLHPQAGVGVFAHELGHAFESYMWDPYWRRGETTLPRLMKRLALLLWLPSRKGILSTFVWTERFAEAYRLCAFGRELPDYYGGGYWGFYMTPERLPQVCAGIWRMGRAYRAS